MAGTSAGAATAAGGKDGYSEGGLLLPGTVLQESSRVQQHTAGQGTQLYVCPKLILQGEPWYEASVGFRHTYWPNTKALMRFTYSLLS